MDSKEEKFDLMKSDERAAILAKEDSIFLNVAKFEQMQRVASMISKTDFIPERFRNNVGNCMIALDMASLMGMHPIMLMRTMYIVHGQPGFEGKFISALINNSGRYTDPLEYEWAGKQGDPKWGCRAYATRKRTGKIVYGPWITWAMVTAEGWHLPKGQPPRQQKSKWTTMPEVMFLYRAATMFGRINDADLLMGMRTIDELEDMHVELSKLPDGSYGPPSTKKPTVDTYKATASAPQMASATQQEEIKSILLDEFFTNCESPFEKSKWFALKTAGFKPYLEAHKDHLSEASPTTIVVMKDKWAKFYNGAPWPYENQSIKQPAQVQDNQQANQQETVATAENNNEVPWHEDGEQPTSQPTDPGAEVPLLETDAARMLAGLAQTHKREYVLVVKNQVPESIDQIYDWINQINEMRAANAQAHTSQPPMHDGNDRF